MKLHTPPTTNHSQLFIENFIDKRKLAEMLSLSPSSINKLMAESKIPFKKIGRSVRFRFSEVVAALERNSTA